MNPTQIVAACYDSVQARAEELERQLEEARATNTSFHRRLQQVEGRAKRRVNREVKETRGWVASSRMWQQRYNELLEKYHAANVCIEELRRQLHSTEETL